MEKDVLISGLKNAIDRGEDLRKAGQSLVNAGYNLEDVKGAMTTFQVRVAPKQLPQESLPQNSKLVRTIQTKNPKLISHQRKIPRWAVITSIIVFLLIIIGAVILGLVWNKLFV